MKLIQQSRFGFACCAASEPLRIVFVIPTLGPGGAERVATLLANYWIGRHHDVTITTFELPNATHFFPLENGVSVRELGAPPVYGQLMARLVTNALRVSRLRSLLRELRPDIVVSFMTEANVVALCACLGLRIPVVISERNQPDRPGLTMVHRIARPLTYPLASAMVVQTEAIAAWSRARFRIPVHVIPNPVQLSPRGTSREEGGINQLVAIGRLTYQKGFDVLIRGFAALADKHPNWQLVIYGEGPDRNSLEALRAESRYENKILLPGLAENSAEPLAKASLFVLPSRFEGYPNVLLEALASGLPVIATACAGGTVEILANGAYGMLVPPDDVTAMTKAVDAMLSTAELRDAYARKARRAVARLDVTTVGERWLGLFAGLKG